jgi:4-hydroxyphenylacetate 3-monooxygenase
MNDLAVAQECIDESLPELRTGSDFVDSIRDGRRVWINGERVEDVATDPTFRPIVDIRARIYDMAHMPVHRRTVTYVDPVTGQRRHIANKLPMVEEDWQRKRAALDSLFKEIGGVVTRVGDETVCAMWSMYDGREVLQEFNPDFARNIEAHMERILRTDPFHVSGNTDPKGDRSKPPQEQDPDMLLHVVRETDAGIIVRGAKYETASAYANQAFVKPTTANWGDQKMSEYAVGFILDDMAAEGLTHICRNGLNGKRREDYPLSCRFDEIDAMLIFDNVLIPWENVLFYRDTAAAAFVRGTLHRYSMYPFTLRLLYVADMLIGTVLHNLKQTGLESNPVVREKMALLVCYREGIDAHLTASIANAERSPAGLLMPNQSLLYAGRVHACSKLPEMMHLARELCGGQICLTPDIASFEAPESSRWLEKYYSINENWRSEDRRKLLAYARDLLNSDYAGHRLSFYLFAHSPPFVHLNAVYNNFDFSGPLEFVRRSAGLSSRVMET